MSRTNARGFDRARRIEKTKRTILAIFTQDLAIHSPNTTTDVHFVLGFLNRHGVHRTQPVTRSVAYEALTDLVDLGYFRIVRTRARDEFQDARTDRFSLMAGGQRALSRVHYPTVNDR